MQWAKAKTIMIWLFLAVDIILISILAFEKINSGKNDREMLLNILNNNNLSIRTELLDIDKTSVFAHEFTGLTLTGETVSYFIKNPVKIDNSTYESADKTAKMQFNSGVLTYDNTAPDFDGFSGINEKNADSKITPFLKKLQIAKYVKPTNIFSINEDIYVEYSYFFDKKELFSSKLTFTVNKNGIKKIYGNINIPNGEQGYSFTLSNIETILMNFIQNNKFKTPETIVSITEGYYCINYENLLLTQAIPVYRIKTTDKTYIYDARDGIDGTKRQLWSK